MTNKSCKRSIMVREKIESYWLCNWRVTYYALVNRDESRLHLVVL